MNTQAQCIDASSAPLVVSCATCERAFHPRRSWARFCVACRNAYHAERGRRGTVKSVRRLKSGWSVTVHVDEAGSLELGAAVRLVRQP